VTFTFENESYIENLIVSVSNVNNAYN